MKNILLFVLVFFSLIPAVVAQKIEKSDYQIVPFGDKGYFKMLYDRRQRPQSVYLNNKVQIVYNGGAETDAAGKSKAKPMIISYDLATSTFSNPVTLGPANVDHHYGPVIWADREEYLHVLFGCHITSGTHLVSKTPGNIGSGLDDWEVASPIAPSISYPSFHRVTGDNEMIYYRDGGHIGAWTYRISDDDGKTWAGPENVPIDMDSKGRFEWSSYQTTFPGIDGKYLHVAFFVYDDNKQNDPERYYNPRYKQEANGWKYNLYYVKIDLQTHSVSNFEGEALKTPVDLDQANEKCRIWDTKWGGAGVPPAIVIDENGDPALLHILSEETMDNLNYYFVYRHHGKWEKTVIAPSNHQWNGSHVTKDNKGIYHAYLVVGDKYLDGGGNMGSHGKGGNMDSHGGGRIEEWISADNGQHWKFSRDLTPDRSKYPGWKFNNIQPVTRPDGSIVEDMLLFYGWEDENTFEAKAFLIHGTRDF